VELGTRYFTDASLFRTCCDGLLPFFLLPLSGVYVGLNLFSSCTSRLVSHSWPYDETGV
jgi:hypothetical protein